MKPEDVFAEATKHAGALYRWGAKGPDRFDCSGLVTYSLFVASNSTLDWRETHNAQMLFSNLEHADAPAPGVLAFYGHDGHANHVMFCTEGAQVFGATGGNSDTVNDEKAMAQHAYVRARSNVNYRPDFLGYRRLPTL